MERKIKYAIIGCGSFGGMHIEALLQTKDIEIVALCDVHKEFAEEKNEKYALNAPCYSDYKEMLENIEADIVVVATADHAHKDATVAALKAGFNVMCEKPMALRHEDCHEMLMAEKESGKLLMVGQVCRFTPAFVRAKQIVESGILGDIFFAEGEYAHDYATIPGVDKWRMHPDREPILGGGCHSIDLLRWLIGDPVEVTAYSNRMVLKDWPISDATIGIMKWENGTIGKIFTSIGCKRDYTMRTCLYGTKGTLIFDNTSPEMSLYLEKSAEGAPFAGGIIYGNGSERTMAHRIKVEINNHNLPGEHKAFRDAVICGKPLIMTGLEGAKTVAVCSAVIESAKTGNSVKVNYDFGV